MPSERLLALELAKGLAPSPKNLARVAKETDDDASRWAFQQWELRKRAAKKFPHASKMLFVGEALEQATRHEVARYHASRFPAGELVADLTAGIGGDLAALMDRGPAVGFEIDLERAFCASFNTDGKVYQKDCFATNWDWQYAFADPGRRVEKSRNVALQDYQPSPIELARRMKQLRLGGMKLSPMNQDDVLEEFGGRLEFLSYGRECLEAVVWLGKDAIPGRFAVHIETGEQLESSGERIETKQVWDFIFEADPAAIRAHCLHTLCNRHDLSELAETNGYLVGKNNVVSPWLSSFRILATAGFHERDLKSFGPISEIKTRGVPLDPAKLLHRANKSSTGNTLLLFKIDRSIHYALAERA